MEPEWFSAISPLGKVPPLKVGHHDALLECPVNLQIAREYRAAASNLAPPNGAALRRPPLGHADVSLDKLLQLARVARQPRAERRRTIDLYIGPEAPEGQEANWLSTAPCRGFFSILRLYGPGEKAIDYIWKPGDFEKVQ